MMLHRHCAKLMTREQLSVFFYTLLDKKSGTSGHLYLYHYGHNQQYGPQKQKTYKCNRAIEYPLKKHLSSLFLSISKHQFRLT
jgi:hypothetical protein